jgi:hypothetical protein
MPFLTTLELAESDETMRPRLTATLVYRVAAGELAGEVLRVAAGSKVGCELADELPRWVLNLVPELCWWGRPVVLAGALYRRTDWILAEKAYRSSRQPVRPVPAGAWTRLSWNRELGRHELRYALTRRQVDALVREAARADGESWVRSWAMWAALRAFGRSAWRP